MPVRLPFLSKVAIEVDVGEILPYYLITLLPYYLITLLPYYLITLVTLGNKLKPTLLPYQVA